MDTLEPNYPVHADYIYVAILEDGTQKAIRSDIQGNVQDLMRDLKSYYKMPVVAIRAAKFEEIYPKKEDSDV